MLTAHNVTRAACLLFLYYFFAFPTLAVVNVWNWCLSGGKETDVVVLMLRRRPPLHLNPFYLVLVGECEGKIATWSGCLWLGGLGPGDPEVPVPGMLFPFTLTIGHLFAGSAGSLQLALLQALLPHLLLFVWGRTKILFQKRNWLPWQERRDFATKPTESRPGLHVLSWESLRTITILKILLLQHTG